MKHFFQKRVIISSICLLVGILIGGFLFGNTYRRSFLSISDCGGTCFNQNELWGLLASVGVQRFERIIPQVVKETPKTVVFESPVKLAPNHYIVIPKKDIKNSAELNAEDMEYIIDIHKAIAAVIQEKNLQKYQVFTNGPGYQHITYLHYHILAQEE